MKRIFLVSLIILTLVVTPAFADYTIYQEDANATSCTNAMCDGDWETSSAGSLNANYSIPAGATREQSRWVMLGDTSEIYNYTIPADCWDYNGLGIVRFQISIGGESEHCYMNNDTLYEFGDNINSALNEEAMLWYVPEIVDLGDGLLYQETADSFSYDGTFASPETTNADDGNYDTASTLQVGNNYYFNYTIPEDAYSFTWSVKDDQSYFATNGTGVTNSTYPEFYPCWNSTGEGKILLQVNYQSDASLFYYCFNGLIWQDTTVIATSSGASTLYEQAGFWQTYVCEYNTVQCFGDEVGVCDGYGWINQTCPYGCGGDSPHCLGGIEAITTDAGDGLGALLSMIAMPIGNFVMLLGVIAGILAIVYGVAFTIKSVFSR